MFVQLSDACVLSGTTNSSGEVWSFYFSYGGKSLARAIGHGSGRFVRAGVTR